MVCRRLVAALLLTASGYAGNELVLAPGAAGKPVIQAAVNLAPAGSTIRLQRGVYREYVSISKPLTLVGDDGAVIDPSEPFHAHWEAAGEYGDGVYRTEVSQPPPTLFLDGKVLAQADSLRTKLSPTMPPGGPEASPWYWKQILKSGTPRTGFRNILGVWVYVREQRVLLVHLAGDTDPNGRDWSVVWRRDPIVWLRNSHDASVRGVALAHGFRGASIAAHCERCVIAQCKIGPWDRDGVMIEDGARNSLAESNDIFRGAYEDWTARTTVEKGRLTVDRDWYEIWQLHKWAGFYDRVGIRITGAGPDNGIHANHIHDTFDGIDLQEFPETLDQDIDVQLDRGTKIWGNLIERTADSGMEVGGGAIDVEIHHNTLRHCHGGLRYKLPRVGPVFIYRNVLIDGSPFDIWYSMDDSPAEGYVYHNTVVGGAAGLAYNGWEHYHNIGAPRWHYMNNLMATPGGFFESSAKGVPVNFETDYNVVQGDGRPYGADTGKDSHSRYVPDVRLGPGFPPIPQGDSPAIDAGLDLSTYLHGKPLPGCDPGYFKGKAPDAGAFEVR